MREGMSSSVVQLQRRMRKREHHHPFLAALRRRLVARLHDRAAAAFSLCHGSGPPSTINQ
jgi:hypothetical protein